MKTAAFARLDDLLAFNALASSIVVDFFVKLTGAGHVEVNLMAQLPLVHTALNPSLFVRTLRLNCLTTHYAPLWSELFARDWSKDGFTKPDPRLPSWSHLGKTWTRDSALRTAYARRQALVEIDALAALALGLTVDELCLLYRVQFPVLQQYERETFYDQNGRIVFTTNKGLPGVGLERKEWQAVKELQPGDKLPSFASRFAPPFDRSDREEDMRQAYAAFQARTAPRHDVAAIADGGWLRPRTDATAETTLALASLLRAAGGPSPQRRLRLALTFMLAPGWLTPRLSAPAARTWRRLIGDDAAPPAKGTAPLIPLVDKAFASALARLRGSRRLVQDDVARTWAPGSGIEEMPSAAWAEGRARFVLDAIDALGLEDLLERLPEEVRRSVDATEAA